MNKKSLIWGVVGTVVWLLLIFLFSVLKGYELPSSLNELGDALAGIVAPIAFLWLILGYIQQGMQLEQNSIALKLQANALEAQIREFKSIVALQEQSTKYKSMSVKPTFELDRGTCIRVIEHDNLDEEEEIEFLFINFYIKNIGKGNAFEIKIVNDKNQCMAEEIYKLNINESSYVDLTITKNEIDTIWDELIWLKLIMINYKDVYGNTYLVPYTLVIRWESKDLTICTLSIREGNDFLKFK